MFLGIGLDLVSIKRIERIYNKHPRRFLERVFSDEERSAFIKRGSSIDSLAACYAAKEAVLKAIGCGIGPAALNEVEVIAAAGSQPEIRLQGEAMRLAAERGINSVLITMTHEPPFAAACAAATNSREIDP